MQPAGTPRSERPAVASLRSLVDDDAPPTEGGDQVGVVPGVARHLVVVDHLVVVALVPDPDPELIDSAPAVGLPVDGRDLEPVVPGPVDGARPLVPYLGPADDHPVVAGAPEVE